MRLQVYMPANNTLYVRIFFDNIPETICTNEAIHISFQHTTLNWWMMHENDRWLLFCLGKTLIKPRRPCPAYLAPRYPRYRAVHSNQTNIVTLNYIIHEPLDPGWAGLFTKHRPEV